MGQHSLVFLHIPKTAGTTLRDVIARQYPEEAIFVIGEDANGDIARFKTVSEATSSDIRVLSGHMSFGLHRYLPPPVTYITVLRDPISRALSDYGFVKSNPYHPIYETVSKMSLTEYMTSGITGQLSNGQTRLISGECKDGNIGIPTVRELTDRDYENALKNLSDFFSVAGTQERFLESLMAMRMMLGWRYPFHTKRNVTTKPLSETTLSVEDKALLKRINQYDTLLYEEVNGRLDEVIRAGGAGLSRDIATFRLLNRLYQGLHEFTPSRLRFRAGLIKRSLLKGSSTHG